MGSVEPPISVSPAPHLPVSPRRQLGRRPSIQEELYGPGATMEHDYSLRPPSARSTTSDGACSATSVHFGWINGQLEPLKDGSVSNTKPGLTAENLASLGN